jgi:predicted aspartyl protease
MSKEREENPFVENLGRIRRRRNMIREGRDSNLLSTETTLIKINKISLLRMNPREKTPWEKGEDHQSNVGDAKKITCTRISLTEKIKMKTMHNIQEATTVEDMGRNIPRIYAALEDRQAEHQSNMIEVEGKIINHPVAILIDSGESHCYIDPKIVDRLHLEKSKLEKSSLVQLATGTKRRINETVRGCPINLNGVNTNVDMNIIPLGSYDILIGMDWLDKHHVVLDCHNKTFTCLDEEGKQSTVKGIPRPISIREISALQLKRCFRKGCQLYATHVEEPEKTKGPSLEYFSVLQEFEDVFQEIPGFPPKREIYFSIDLVPGASPVSKNLLTE